MVKRIMVKYLGKYFIVITKASINYTYRYYIGAQPYLAVLDPDILKEIAIKNFDNFTERKVRPSINCTFLCMLQQ